MNRDAAVFLASFDDSRFPEDFLKAYDILECLSQNEYGETYLVRNRSTAGFAVAKCYMGEILPHVQEHELLQRLHHRDLPAYIGTYANAGMLCVLREYVEGTPLHIAREERAFTSCQVVAIGIALCDILRYLHGQNPPIIHRDIKPENIILREDGSVALIDFGISRAYRQGADTDTMNFGTKRFSAPEQYGYAQTDRRSDVFSLGMVMGYLLTGSTRVDAFAGIPDKGLARVLQTCTAFDPAGRYASVDACRRALCALLPVRRKRRRWLTALAGAAVVALAVLAAICAQRHAAQYAFKADGQALAATPVSEPAFTEPLIEQAVRATLCKSDTDMISPEELKTVDTLCVFGGEVSKDQDGFYASANAWYAADTRVKGDISSLEDLRLLPNLRVICLAAQQISDLSPLSALPALEKAELKHNRISDVSVLATLPVLASVGLNDNPVTDLSPLSACKGLRFLDLCSVRGYDPSFLNDLGDFEFLDIANETDTYAYLGARRIRELKLGYTALDSLAYLSGVTGLQMLEVKHSRLTSLGGVEAHAELAYLNIAGCAIEDLSSLMDLPALKTLVLSEDMRPALDALGPVPFTVSFE